MSSLVERRKPISQTAMVLAVMFWSGVGVALFFGGVPTWQNHGPDAGPGFIRKTVDPQSYYWMSGFYLVVAAAATFLTFFRFPRVTITHIRLLFLAAFVLLISAMIYFQFRAASGN